MNLKTIWSFIMNIFSVIMSYFPSALPTGMTDFVKWQDSILRMSQVPDNDSTRFASAVMILHLDSTTTHKPKRYFVKALNKGAANEVAGAVCQALKEKQQAAMKAAQEAKIAADAATKAAAQESTPTQGTTNGLAQDTQVSQAPTTVVQ